MKISKRQLKRIIKEEKRKLLREANPDGTIEDNEDMQRERLMADVADQAKNIIYFIQSEADRIGGGFRGPGIREEALKVLADIVHRAR